MSKKTKKFSQTLPEIDFLTAASTTDCTGLIPSAPQNDAELDSYMNIMKFSPTDINTSRKK